MPSTFSDFAPKYYEKNLTVIPVRGKAPAIKEWPKYCETAPSEAEFDSWCDTLGASGLSLICGPSTGIIGIDIDTDDAAILEVIDKTLPLTPVAKKGRRGFTLFYRFNFSPKAPSAPQGLVAKGRRVVDILAAKHTVLPPSIHPDTNLPYEWITQQTLLDIDFDEIPWITVADLEKCQLALNNLKGSPLALIKGHKTGRNDYLKGVASKLIAARTPTDEAVSILIKEDRLAYGKNGFFSDKKEASNAGFDHEWVNAHRFFSSNYVSIGRRNLRAKKPVELPYEAKWNNKKNDVNFENESTGFYIVTEKGAKKPDYYGLADFMIHEHRIYSDEGYARYFDKTHYKDAGGVRLNQLFSKHTHRQIMSTSQYSMFNKVLLSQAFGREALLNDTDGFINLRNGIFDLANKELIAHNWEYNFCYTLDYDYVSDAKCPRFIGFLEDIFNGDKETINLVRTFMAYTLMGGYPFLHRALCFTGSGRNGKSTLIDVIRALLGNNNVSSVSLSKINDHFQAVLLDGKLANLVEELPIDVIPPEAFKNIISGGQVAMSKKFKDVYHKPINARFIFATNETPIFKDTSAGLHERIEFVDFPKYIPVEERVTDLREQLFDEISGILNWVLEIMPLDKSAPLAVPETSIRLKEMFLSESNSAIAWWEDRIECTRHDFDSLGHQEMFNDYVTWCDNNKMRGVGKKKFIKRVKEYIKLCVKGKVDEKPLVSRNSSERYVKRIKFRRNEFSVTSVTLPS